MAQWRELLKLETTLKSRVRRLYHERKVPIEIRRCFSDWIESQDWDLAVADEALARTCFQTLLLKLDERIKESLYNNHTLEGPDFSLLKDQLMYHFEHHPVELAEKLSECLKEEKMILDSLVVDQPCSTTPSEQTQTDLDNKVNTLKIVVKKIEEEIKVLEKEELMYKKWETQGFAEDSYCYRMVLCKMFNHFILYFSVKELNGLVNFQMQQKCLNEGNAIRTKKQVLVDHVQRSVNLAKQIIQTLVSVALPEWKRIQQMSCIGNPVVMSLDQLEKWFSSVGEMLLQIVQQLKKLMTNDVSNMSEVLQKIYKKTTELLIELLRNALVVEKQPVMFSQLRRPLVLRTKVSFCVKLRFLAKLPNVKDGCLIRAEFDKFRQFQFTTNNTKVMSTDKENGSLVAELVLEIIEMKTKRKRSNVTPIRVTEELHIIKFSTDLQVAGLQCPVETSSLPMVVVSTTTQGPSAWASVMWWNLLSVKQPTGLSVFMDPPPLSWELLSQALSWQFISAGDRELSQDQLHELKLKITDDPEELVLWSKFSSKDGPWIWIDGILDLIEKHLKALWRDGSIMGFVNKDKARVLLQKSQSGNFLLRFSESNREGAVSFSLVEHRKKKTNVRDIDPFTKEELSRMSLADHINQYREKGKSSNPLAYLYPDIPKDNAFGRYYSTTETSKPITPYVRRTYVCEADCPAPPSSSPDHTQMDLDEDLMDIPTPQLLYSNTFDETELFSSVTLYNADNNNMEVSENF